MTDVATKLLSDSLVKEMTLLEGLQTATVDFGDNRWSGPLSARNKIFTSNGSLAESQMAQPN